MTEKNSVGGVFRDYLPLSKLAVPRDNRTGWIEFLNFFDALFERFLRWSVFECNTRLRTRDNDNERFAALRGFRQKMPMPFVKPIKDAEHHSFPAHWFDCTETIRPSSIWTIRCANFAYSSSCVIIMMV